MVVMVMMDKMEKMMMVVTKTMHLVTSQVEVNMVGKVQWGCCCHCACKNLKSLITLDPVGSTMRYEVSCVLGQYKTVMVSTLWN